MTKSTAMREKLTSEKLPKPREEIKSFKFWKAVRCEFLVTMFYVLIGCGSTVTWHNSPKSELKVAFAFGFSAATLVQCVGHISGAHMNPAVTLAMLVTENISLLRAVLYVIAQCAGGIAGAGILFGITPLEGRQSLGVTQLDSTLGLGQAFGVEFLTTLLVVFTVFANLEQKRMDMGSRSLAIGLAVTVCHLFSYPYTGASMNPARSLGPAIVTNIWSNHWVYWVGPVLGGVIGGFTYEYNHDSSPKLQTLRRSFRRRPMRSTNLSRSCSVQSCTNSTVSTEMAFSPPPLPPAAPPTGSNLTFTEPNGAPTPPEDDKRI